MKKIVLIMLLAAGSLLAQGIHWEKDFKSAVAKAKKVHKPIMFVYSNHGCKWCIHLEKTTFKSPNVIARLNSDFVNVIAYTDSGDYVPRELWLPGTPGIWFLDSNGEAMFQPIQGAIGAKELMSATDIVKKEFHKLQMKQMYGPKKGQ